MLLYRIGYRESKESIVLFMYLKDIKKTAGEEMRRR